jgi:hypothetical protein
VRSHFPVGDAAPGVGVVSGADVGEGRTHLDVDRCHRLVAQNSRGSRDIGRVGHQSYAGDAFDALAHAAGGGEPEASDDADLVEHLLIYHRSAERLGTDVEVGGACNHRESIKRLAVDVEARHRRPGRRRQNGRNDLGRQNRLGLGHSAGVVGTISTARPHRCPASDEQCRSGGADQLRPAGGSRNRERRDGCQRRCLIVVVRVVVVVVPVACGAALAEVGNDGVAGGTKSLLELLVGS